MMNSRCARYIVSVVLAAGTAVVPVFAAEDAPYLEPGSLRLSHDLTLEGVFHRVRPGWRVVDSGLNKTYSLQENKTNPWRSEWGQSLLTEAAARLTPDIQGRVLFEAQGEYADRLWRPVNINHDVDKQGNHFVLREAEASIEKEAWYWRWFSGVGHSDWRAQGDFFTLYPASFPDDDYLGTSGHFGIYPDRWKQHVFLNITRRRIPSGSELGASVLGWEAAVAAGEELVWGYDRSYYGRLSAPLLASRLTFVFKSEEIPFLFLPGQEERRNAFALSWMMPWESGHRLETGVMYQPFRVDERYRSVSDVPSGTGLLGSSYAFSQKRTKESDAFAERLRFEYRPGWTDLGLTGVVDATHAGVLAGNKNEANAEVWADLTSVVRGAVKYTYRTPVEDPIPLLYEGNPNDIGAIAANPRGPESPFTVDWTNREAVFLETTLWFDPSPGSSAFRYDPANLSIWNLNPEEDAPMTVAVQHRMSDYRGTTDRQFYFNESGEVVWEPAGHTGAWPTARPVHEFRVLTRGRWGDSLWTAGFAGGEALAISGLAYTSDAQNNKPISEYYSVEGRLDYWPFALWAHYGTGVWGPEGNLHRYFGLSFDRLWGMGASYNITTNTTWDVAYLAARQDDTLFLAPDLGSYDEIRTLFSHRFGFLVQFQEPARKGYRVR